MRKPWSKIALLGFSAALVVVALAAISGFGHRWAWWDFGAGFAMLKQAAYGSFVALALCVVGAALARPGTERRGFLFALIGVALSGIVAYVPWYELRKVRALPAIHDITTDTESPPQFVAVLPLRGENSNSTVYAGAAIAAMQRSGYPDIAPFITSLSPQSAFEKALAAATHLGWDIVAAEPKFGRIEATDTTFWYGFKDDVVIRIAEVPQGSRVDVRSVSRVGGSDVGANAARIRAFFHELGPVDPAKVNGP